MCYGIIVKQELTAEYDSMIVGLRNFHKRREVVPDSNFWCGCPEASKNEFPNFCVPLFVKTTYEKI